MQRDELEFRISQSLDGGLDAQEQAQLDETLASDGAARELLAGYRALNVMLKNAPAPPQIEWDRLSSEISLQVAEADHPRGVIFSFIRQRTHRLSRRTGSAAAEILGNRISQ